VDAYDVCQRGIGQLAWGAPGEASTALAGVRKHCRRTRSLSDPQVTTAHGPPFGIPRGMTVRLVATAHKNIRFEPGRVKDMLESEMIWAWTSSSFVVPIDACRRSGCRFGRGMDVTWRAGFAAGGGRRGSAAPAMGERSEESVRTRATVTSGGEWDIGAGTISLAIPKSRRGVVLPGVAAGAALAPSPVWPRLICWVSRRGGWKAGRDAWHCPAEHVTGPAG
jgi:hypothetical protein